MRWKEAGGALVDAPKAIVGHAHHLSLSGFFRQHMNYGKGARHLRQSALMLLSQIAAVTGYAKSPIH